MFCLQGIKITWVTDESSGTASAVTQEHLGTSERLRGHITFVEKKCKQNTENNQSAKVVPQFLRQIKPGMIHFWQFKAQSLSSHTGFQFGSGLFASQTMRLIPIRIYCRSEELKLFSLFKTGLWYSISHLTFNSKMRGTKYFRLLLLYDKDGNEFRYL